MKKGVLLVIALLFIIVGCEENNSILEPGNEELDASTLNKGRIIWDSRTYDDYDYFGDDDTNDDDVLYGDTGDSEGIANPNWIVLPEEGLEISTSKWVNGADETLLDLNTSVQGGLFGAVQVNATLRFKRGSFDGSRYITMSINSKYGNATFSPSGSFDIPAIYNATIMGLDLSGINKEDIQFVYMAEDGLYYPIDVQSIFVEPQSGKLQVIDAKLPHFSRYGWVRTK